VKTQYYTAASLDGFVADENDSLEWLDRLGDPEESSYPEFIAGVGVIAMGAATYEWLLRNHVRPEGREGAPWPYEIPAWVFTHRDLAGVEGADIRFVRGDVRPVHQEMRRAAAGKNVWIAGGGGLAGQFLDAGLLDEIIVQVGSVTLGAGKPLLPRAAAPPFKLVAVRQYGPGFVELRYEVRPSDG